MNSSSSILNIHLLAYWVPPSQFGYAHNISPNPTTLDLGSDKIPNFTMDAISAFFALVLVEWIIGIGMGKKLYRLNDTLVSIMLGGISLLTGLLFKTLQITSYAYIYSHYRFADFPVDGWITWIGLLLGCDVAYYWMHRMAHTYHFMWNGHSVHHSGEDYNLSTALRQGALQGLFSWLFYLPLAVVGFHPACYLGHSALNTLGQFWIHTKLIGDLGPLEYFLNTPSHHRCHHRIPGNCNYAGVLIIWDRMFGTFEAETEQIEKYGLAVQHKTFDPVHANVQHGIRIVADEHGGWSKLLKTRTQHKWVFDPLVLFKPLHPSKKMFSNWIATDNVIDAQRVKLDFPQSNFMSLHCFVHFIIVLICTLAFLVASSSKSELTVLRMSIFSFGLLWCYSCLGRLFDAPNVYSYLQESVRLVLLLVGFTQHRNKISDGKYSSQIFGVVCSLIIVWLMAMRSNWKLYTPAVSKKEGKEHVK